MSGYTGQWAGGEKTLVEASLSEAEDRHHGASVYVTKVYEQERTRLNELIRYAIRKRLVEV